MDQVLKKERLIDTIKKNIQRIEEDTILFKKNNSRHAEREKIQEEQIFKMKDTNDQKIQELNKLSSTLERLQGEVKALKSKHETVKNQLQFEEENFAKEKEQFRQKLYDFSSENRVKEQLEKLKIKHLEAVELRAKIDSLLSFDSNMKYSEETEDFKWLKKEQVDPDNAHKFKYEDFEDSCYSYF